MLATYQIVLLGVSMAFFGLLAAGVVGTYATFERRATFGTAKRRTTARGAVALGVVVYLCASLGLAGSFVLDWGDVFGVDILYVGVGAVFVSALPLLAGFTLVFHATDLGT